ncbi:hypothetical protein COB52_06005 [Candidatus Kaiserbacteria bacterium]|nr:MAG: hypothetical protein COB52_06005 [Candidatus Kaiserbacteria bacterium]
MKSRMVLYFMLLLGLGLFFQNCFRPNQGSLSGAKKDIHSLVGGGIDQSNQFGGGAGHGSLSDTTEETAGDGSQSVVQSGNGEGYGGKLKRYVDTGDDSVCDDGSLAESTIELRDEKAWLVRDECKEIEPRAVDLDLKPRPHGEKAAVFGEKIFSLQGDDATQEAEDDIEIVCRGKSGSFFQLPAEVDVLIRKKESGYFADFSYGLYDSSGGVKESNQIVNVAVKKDGSDNSFLGFTARYSSVVENEEDESFVLEVQSFMGFFMASLETVVGGESLYISRLTCFIDGKKMQSKLFGF